jgi:hypothetical protein
VSGNLPPAAERFSDPLALQVHGILWRAWDPCGVNAHAPNDEYDRYVPEVVALIVQRAAIEDIAEYLDWGPEFHEALGAPPRAALLALAAELVALTPDDRTPP